jgi:hypothetical protein
MVIVYLKELTITLNRQLPILLNRQKAIYQQ